MSSLCSRSRFCLALTLALFADSRVKADTIIDNYSGSFPATLTGTLPNQGTALLENFQLNSQSDLAIATTSYASGGFQTNLVLFDGLGRFVAASIPSGTPDPATGLIGDSSLSAVHLSSGNYTLALTDFLLNQSITATNLSDGFTSNFGDGTTFIDANGNTRTGAYAFNIDVRPAPEPASIWLAAIGIGCVAAFVKRHRNASPTNCHISP